MVPSIVKARSELLMEAIDDGNMLSSCCGDHVLYMRDGIGPLEIIVEKPVELPVRVKEVIVGIDQENCCVADFDGGHLG